MADTDRIESVVYVSFERTFFKGLSYALLTTSLRLTIKFFSTALRFSRFFKNQLFIVKKCEFEVIILDPVELYRDREHF